MNMLGRHWLTQLWALLSSSFDEISMILALVYVILGGGGTTYWKVVSAD